MTRNRNKIYLPAKSYHKIETPYTWKDGLYIETESRHSEL